MKETEMGGDQAGILADLTDMLHAILDDHGVASDITMDTTFRGDLEMESIDIISLAGRLQVRYGDAVNFAQFVAALDLEAVKDLRVGQLVEFIGESLSKAEAVAS